MSISRYVVAAARFSCACLVLARSGVELAKTEVAMIGEENRPTRAAHARVLEAHRPGDQLCFALPAAESKRRRALQTELQVGRVLSLAAGTLHAKPPVDRAGRRR